MGDVRALKLIRAWRLAAGPIFGSKAKFHGLQRNAAGEQTLMLDLDDPIWKQELLHQSQHLLELFCTALRSEGFLVSELPVKVSLTPSKSLPFKTGNTQFRRHK
jgi:hypothetical protein